MINTQIKILQEENKMLAKRNLVLRNALSLQILEKDPYKYILSQFPAAEGHIPLRTFFEEQKKVL